jgi:glutamyl-tRNA reductase
MFLGSLRVIHLAKSGVAVKPPAAFADLFGETFHVDSCQRWIWVDAATSSLDGGRADLTNLDLGGAKVYEGAEAYQFLLQVATGLESQVIGETDIFGQLKDAWKLYSKNPSESENIEELVSKLAPIMQKLFEDTKEIRTQYLQNLGGSSYGSLLRKLMREKDLVDGPSLLIGAGLLAEGVAPYLDHDLLISNRNPERAEALASTLRKQSPDARVRVLSSFEEEMEAMKTVSCVVLAIPVKVPPNGMDAKRIAYLKTRSDIHVIHLGARSGESADWDALPSFDSLDSLFEIEKSLSRTRSVQVERARSACRERSKLRSLGGSFVAHGWEDLAIFA